MSDSSDPTDCSPPGSPVHGICQARVLEWVAIAFSDVKEQGHTNCFLSLSALTSTPVSNHIDGQPLLIGKTEGERVSAPVLVMLLCWWEGWVCFLSASHSPWGMPSTCSMHAMDPHGAQAANRDTGWGQCRVQTEMHNWKETPDSWPFSRACPQP